MKYCVKTYLGKAGDGIDESEFNHASMTMGIKSIRDNYRNHVGNESQEMMDQFIIGCD